MSEVEKIISSARNKYTVHECGECTYRKCCELGFGSAGCMSRRVSISLMLGIEDNFFTKLLDDILAAWKRERAEAVGNAAALREAVVALLDALDSLGCDEETATLAAFVPDMADSSAKCLAAFRKAKDALSAPPRNCDLVNSYDEAEEKFGSYCVQYETCRACSLLDPKDCRARWLLATSTSTPTKKGDN